MATQQATVVGVFPDRQQAQRAVRALRDAGFREDQIGLASSGQDSGTLSSDADTDSENSYAGEGAMTGLAAGAGVGALWGLGILSGVLPVIGPAIAGGTLGVLLSSAAAGAATAGVAGLLAGMGVPKEEAEYYESEMHAGRSIVTVNAGDRRSEAFSIIQRHGGYDASTRSATQFSTPSSDLAANSAMGSGAAGEDYRANLRSSTAESGSKPPPASSMHAASATHATGGTVRAHEEKLQVNKTPAVQTGEVEVRKEVHTEHKTIDVPVTREEIVIERHSGSGRPVSSETVIEGQEIRIPVREDQVNVSKQTVVAEEVTIGKKTVQDTERVDENLRKEEIKVETHGNANVRHEDRK